MSNHLPAENRFTLSHWARKPLGEIVSTEQALMEGYHSAKPQGLWVSVDGEDDWQSWCESNMPYWINGVPRYRVVLIERPNILVLSSPWMLDDFQHEYGHRVRHDIAIDWKQVASEYNGIIIAPYHWSHRMDMMWYYGWDCASGCIWNKDVIAKIEELRAAA